MLHRLLTIPILIFGTFCLCASLPTKYASHSFRPDTWEDVPVSTGRIQWYNCPSKYQKYSQISCMRLEVPLDYDDRAAGTTTIAFLKHLAEHASADTPRILYNPGGPGVSGIDISLLSRSGLRKKLGPDSDIIAFDPRGVGHSKPDVDCFGGDYDAAIRLATADYGNLVNATFFKGGLWGDACKKNLDASARYIGTPAVARDMLSYAKRQEATLGFDHAKAMVNFYGGSYGTVLGATFATLYPNRVGRFALDSVAQGKPHYLGGRSDTIADQDEAIFQLFRQCSEAGPERCKFWAGTAHQTEARYQRLLENLEASPLDIHYNAVAVDAPPQITADVVRRHVIGAAYSGHFTFRALANRLALLERGDYRSWVHVKAVPAPSCRKCSSDDWRKLLETFSWPVGGDANRAIGCIDKAPQPVATLEAFEDFMTAAQDATRFFGGLLSEGMASCLKWPFRPPPSQQFDGIFGANISQPMLILTNTYDPVTPAVNARQLVTQFPGSVLVERKAVGHGTRGSCVENILREYFESATLPELDTFCMPDERPSLNAGP